MTGKGHDYLKAKFFRADCTGQQQKAECSVYLDCCNTWLEFSITYEGLEWCGGDTCTVSVDLQRVTEATKAYRYLNDTIFWKNGFIDAFVHPKIHYCDQPGFAQFIVLLLLPILALLILVIKIVGTIAKIACEAATLTLGRCDLGPIDDLSVCTLFEYTGGCGRFSPSPLIREILEYNATQAGITFQSSIFQELPYSNTALFQLQYEKGSTSQTNWIEENAANLTTIQLLDQLKDPFNLDYRIIDNVLIVERKDFFESLATDLGDVSDCISFIQGEACAYGDYQYTDDSVDRQGTRLRSNYDDIIEFNPEAAEWKTGKCEVTARFGRARFMFDQRGFDRADDVPGGDREGFLGDNFIDRFRNTNILNISGCGDDRRARDLIITGPQSAVFKLLVLEDGFNRSDAFTIRKEIGRRGNLTFWAYNYPMYFREDEPEGLYNRFHIIDNPNNSGRQIYEMPKAELPFSCEILRKLEASEGGYKVETTLGTGFTDNAEVDFSKSTITLNNIKIKC